MFAMALIPHEDIAAHQSSGGLMKINTIWYVRTGHLSWSSSKTFVPEKFLEVINTPLEAVQRVVSSCHSPLMQGTQIDVSLLLLSISPSMCKASSPNAAHHRYDSVFTEVEKLGSFDRTTHPIEQYLDHAIITNGLTRAFSTGSWSYSYKSWEKTSSIVAFIRRATPLQMVSDMRRTRQHVLYAGKAGDARYPMIIDGAGEVPIAFVVNSNGSNVTEAKIRYKGLETKQKR
ncbi:DNA-directed RNA polymerases IV and V subunit 2-like protein [Tanacetum coccineum]